MQTSNDLVQGNIFKFGVEWKGGKNVRFSAEKLPPISETAKDTAKVTINH